MKGISQAFLDFDNDIYARTDSLLMGNVRYQHPEISVRQKQSRVLKSPKDRIVGDDGTVVLSLIRSERFDSMMLAFDAIWLNKCPDHSILCRFNKDGWQGTS